VLSACLARARRQLRPRSSAECGRFPIGVRPSAASADDLPPSPIDEVVATFFRAPKSYTREDVVEIAAHGSPAVLHGIVSLAIEAGARLAEPGEFTLRAHLNGRLDLVQAEAVADLVDAVTPLQARAAFDQLDGTLTAKIAAVEARLFDLVARLEASVDFPEEGFHFVSKARADTDLRDAIGQVRRLIADGRSGRLLREGAVVAIVGRPNAGKSSLFNALVGASRAIVTADPGTTRDALTERVDLAGIPLTLVDTAGLRSSTDAAEIEGVRRARAVVEIAALCVLVIDGSAPVEPADRELLGGAQPLCAVMSKADQPQAWSVDDLSGHQVVRVSALTGLGLDELRERIAYQLSMKDEWRDPPAVTNIRHVTLLSAAEEAMERAWAGRTHLGRFVGRPRQFG
jgi:tRNA modification GTPase